MASHVDGQNAPDFTLTDTHGQQASLAQYRGDRSAVLLFNRGLV